MYSLTREMVDWNRRMLNIPAEKMKGGRPLDIPLNELALAIIEHEWRDGSDLTD